MRHRKGRVAITVTHVKLSKRTVSLKTYRKAPGSASGKPPGYKKLAREADVAKRGPDPGLIDLARTVMRGRV